MRKQKIVAALMSMAICISPFALPCENAFAASDKKSSSDETIVLKVCNWEEYIDEGGWDEDEAIDLENSTIIGENSLIKDFEEWYKQTYGVNVKVEYSTFGTNEDLYNQLNLGDVYDLVCPSDYLIMKLMVNKELEPYDDSFFDKENKYNYYIKGVSPYIYKQFDSNKISGESWSKYAAGYMWGTTGIVYNPDKVSKEDVSTWDILRNFAYNRKITIKDNVRDAYFAALGLYKKYILTNKDFVNDKNYNKRLSDEMNDVSKSTMDDVEDILKEIKDNVYSFETDSGKSDMVTGKIVANFQWSGDAVFAMDQAQEDGVYLDYSVPKECTNLWFDGWVMLKNGIKGNSAKKQAAQAFVNFMSRPDNVVRNMYYIGYTSVIAGGDDSTILEYLDWCYGAEDDEEDTIDYDVNYFFNDGESSDDYIIIAPASQAYRQLYAQYPTEDVINRSAIMWYFDDDASKNINQMWINVRCFDIKTVPVAVWIAIAIALVVLVVMIVRKKITK